MKTSFASRYPLRVTMVVVIIVLMAVGLLIAGATSAAVLNNYLHRQVNEQLVQSVQRPRDGFRTPTPQMNQGFGPFTDGLYIQIANSGGQIEQRGGQVDDPPVVSFPPTVIGVPYGTTSKSGGTTWQVITAEISPGEYLTIGRDTTDITETVSNLITIELAVGGIVIVLAALGGYVLVRKSLEPLNQVEHAAGQIAQGDLSHRVPDLPEATEVGSLAKSLNAMLSQIEQSFDQQRMSEQQARESEERMRRFVADASHELRTPLTSILGYAELFQSRDPASLQIAGAEDVGRIESEASRMRVIVEDLLLLAKLDEERPLELEPVDLLSVATDAVHSIQVVAPSRVIDLRIDAGEPPMVKGDAQGLRRVLLNLLQNAVAYTPPDTPIHVTLDVNRAAGPGAVDNVVVEVRDFGPGLDNEDLSRIFERFYRGEKSRSRETGGMGLGLSIVESIVKSHGGNVTAIRGDQRDEAVGLGDFEAADLGPGTIFRVELPLVATHS